jgi:hypothetical protein
MITLTALLQIGDLFKPFACDPFQVLSSFDFNQRGSHSKGCPTQQSVIYLTNHIPIHYSLGVRGMAY